MDKTYFHLTFYKNGLSDQNNEMHLFVTGYCDDMKEFVESRSEQFRTFNFLNALDQDKEVSTGFRANQIQRYVITPWGD